MELNSNYSEYPRCLHYYWQLIIHDLDSQSLLPQMNSIQVGINAVNEAKRVQKDSTEGEDEICDKCLRESAEIFQQTGEYCLQCWQDLTHSNV